MTLASFPPLHPMGPASPAAVNVVSPRPRRSKGLAVIFALTCIALPLGVWGFFPYLVQEHSRLGPREALLIWIGDLSTLVWFLRFASQHLFQGRPLRSRSWAEFKREREWLFALGSLLLACGLDLAVTLFGMHHEKTAFESAQVVNGQVLATEVRFGRQRNTYVLHCRYQDQQGKWHDKRFRAEEKLDTGFPPGLPPQTARAIQDDLVPFPIRISYDPDQTERSWLTDFGWDDSNRLYYFSLVVLVVQGMCLLLFIELLAMVTYHTGRVPWWFDLYKAFPFLIEVAFLALCGCTFRLAGEDLFSWV